MRRVLYYLFGGLLILTLAACGAAADQPKPTPVPTIDHAATKEATSLHVQAWLASTSPQDISDLLLHSAISDAVLPMGGVVTSTELAGDMNLPLTIDVNVDNSASGVNHYESAAFLTISSGWTTSIRYRIYANTDDAAKALIQDQGTGPITYSSTTVAGTYPAIVTNALPMGITTNYGVTVGQTGPILVSATASYESYNFEAPNESPMMLSTEMVEVGIHHLEQLALTSDRSTPASSSPSQDAKFISGERVIVSLNDSGADGHGLNLRTSPMIDSSNGIGYPLSSGTQLTIVDGPKEVNDETWYQVRLADGTIGWVVGKYLSAG
ncbi:MAG: SH3 domain-containing protein [Thermomicrobiales bacterium]